jgi:hypothetical protein
LLNAYCQNRAEKARQASIKFTFFVKSTFLHAGQREKKFFTLKLLFLTLELLFFAGGCIVKKSNSSVKKSNSSVKKSNFSVKKITFFHAGITFFHVGEKVMISRIWMSHGGCELI